MCVWYVPLCLVAPHITQQAGSADRSHSYCWCGSWTPQQASLAGSLSSHISPGSLDVGFGGHDGAEPLISRTVTSETHFPTIKEREKLSGPTQAVSTALSQTLVCVCECVSRTSSHSQRCLHTLVSFPSCVVIKHFQMCLIQKTAKGGKWTVILSTMNQISEDITGVWWGSTSAPPPMC